MQNEKYKWLSIEILAPALISRGCEREVFELEGKMFSRFTRPDGWTWVARNRMIEYPFVSAATQLVASSKDIAYAFATKEGIAIPRTHATTDAADSATLDFLQQYAPLVAKPVDGFASRGITLHIDTPAKLQDAIQAANISGKGVLLQQQFTGQEVRFTVMNNQVISVIMRKKPQVVGDGSASIAELVRRENHEREQLVFEYLAYPQLTEAQVGSAMTDTRVPAAGEVVQLGTATMMRDGASCYEISDEIHPSYARIAEHLTAKLNPAFLVVDLMIADHTQPANPDNYVFLECNTGPALKVYTSLRGGTAPDIVGLLADAIIAAVPVPATPQG